MNLDISLFQVIYSLAQLIYTLLMVLPSYFVYSSYYRSCAWLITVYLIGTWNGASYYIEIFSTR